MPKNKKDRREIAIKKEKQKKIKTISIVAAVVLIIVAVAGFIMLTETYTDGHANIVLYPIGRFSANLYHGEKYSGSYRKSADGTQVTFTYAGSTIVTVINGDWIGIPHEWADSHGHGSYLQKK